MKTETQYALRKDLRPDPNQPRKDFPAAEQEELRENIKANDIQDALIVRADPEKKTKWMIVEGERRWRIAGELKLDRLPIAVREFKDEGEVRNYQRIVGTQRLNLSALEAATAFGAALEAARAANPKLSVTDFAAAQGVARAVAYETLALLKVSAPVKAALAAGKLDASKARVFAKVPPAEHARLLKVATEVDHYDGTTMSVRQLEKVVTREYSRQLNGAPFDPKATYETKGTEGSPHVKGKAGLFQPCAECPARSGNIEGLEGNPNVCTNVGCFASKVKAHTEAVLAKAHAEGARVVGAEEYARQRYAKFQPADETVYEAKGKTLGQLAKAAKIAPVVTVNAEGRVVEVFTNEDVAQIRKAAGIKEDDYRSNEKAQFKKRKKREAAFEAVAKAATAKILDKLVGKTLEPKLWSLLTDAIAQEAGIERTTFVAKRRGLAKTQTEATETLEAWLTSKERTDRDRQQFIVEILLCASWNGGGWHETKFSDAFQAAAKLAGVKLEKLQPEGGRRKAEGGSQKSEAGRRRAAKKKKK